MIVSWRKERRAYVGFGKKSSEISNINIGLPEGSSLSLYLIIVYDCDLNNCIRAPSDHLFAGVFVEAAG
jgi:hypothetical protein